MAGVEKIKEKILQDCESSVSSILAEAQKQAEAIFNKGQLQANEKAEAIRKKAINEAAQKEKIANSMAELEMRKNVLMTKQDIIEDVFKAVLDRLSSLEPAEYQKVLFGMLLNAIQTGDEEIVLSGNAKAKLSADFTATLNKTLAQSGKNGNVRLSDDTANITGGFIIKSQGVEINNSFEALIRMFRDDIEPKVAQMLF